MIPANNNDNNGTIETESYSIDAKSESNDAAATNAVASLPFQQQSCETFKPTELTLSFYLSLALFANLFFLFYKGYASDLGYWQDWIRQLSSSGYDSFDGNYPPLYIHWLYIVGKIYAVIDVPLEPNTYLKFFSQIPIIVAHGIFLAIIYYLQKTHSGAHGSKQALMLFAAVNPAFMVNGPMWGQIDLLPSVIALLSILCATSHRWVIWAIPLFTIALLTKFQMIAFAPILGFLVFRNLPKHLIGILISVLIGVAAFLPSIVSGHFIDVFKQAYIDTLGQYPMTTLNAANLWILLTGNVTPDHVMLFGVDKDSAFGWIFIAKHFGMLLFSCLALTIFLVGLNTLYRQKFLQSQVQLTQFSLFCATLCAFGFFILLPAMHERYLFPATVMAMALWACSAKMAVYAVILSIACALNMLIILEINGSNIWNGLAAITVVLFVAALLHFLAKAPMEHLFSRLRTVLNQRFTWIATSLIGLTLVTYVLQNTYAIHKIALKDNQIWLTSITPTKAAQSHGKMKINRSYDGNYLSLGNRRYEQGIGTHTHSVIEFPLPENAATFSFIAGIDDEIGTADAQFFVYGDDKLLWQSPMYFGYEKRLPTTTLNIKGVRVLRLQVTEGKEDKWDHVDWVNTIITLEE